MNQKLTLNKQTIVHLNREDLQEINAGGNVACFDNTYTIYTCTQIKTAVPTVEAALVLDSVLKSE